MPKPSFKFKLEWQAQEYEHKERNSDWFWSVGIISVAIAITAIILGNIIFAILIIVAVFALSLFANRPPQSIHVIIDEIGVTRDKILYPYSVLESFWIDLDHPHKKIILRSNKLLMPLIVVPLNEEVDPDEIHEKLSLSLKEEFHPLPFVERMLEYFGF